MASYQAAASNAAKPGRLNAAFVRSVSRPGVYGDQHGLRLRVYKSRKRQSISKQWIWRGTVNGTRRDIGLGGFPYVTLAEARQTAFEYRKTARAGGDPVTLRRRPDVPTFAQAAETVIAIHREGWKDGGKSEAQWRASLRDYAMPRLGRKGVDEITTADVMAVLIPHWHTKTETMRRVRQRIGAVMKWAVAQGHRDDNPAGDAIATALPKNSSVRQHQRALPFRDVGAALARVRTSDAYRPAVLAFEFLVLTACRSGEVRYASWDEIDFASATWTIPARRMKARREHRVPLSARAAGGSARSAQVGGRLGSGLSVAARPRDPRWYGLQAHAGAGDRRGAARLPVVVSGLGGGVHRFPSRGLRTRPGACELRSCGSHLSTDRFLRPAPGAHGAMVGVRRR